MDIRLAIIILSEYVGRYSTIRPYRIIVSTSNVRRLADLRPDVQARPTFETTNIGLFVDAISRVGARRDGKPLLSSEAVAHVFTRANTTSGSGVEGGNCWGIPTDRLTVEGADPDGRLRLADPDGRPRLAEIGRAHV